MNRAVLDLWVGVFVAIGVASLLFLSLKVGNLSSANFAQTYSLIANFDNIGGLKVRGPVKASGVVVGRVADIRYDGKDFQAVVTMNIDTQYKFPKDTFASILTSGLLGEQYVGLDVGGDMAMLNAGDTIFKTQSAVVIERLISQFMFDKAAQNNNEEK